MIWRGARKRPLFSQEIADGFPLLILVAAKPSQRAPYRWVVDRMSDGVQSGREIAATQGEELPTFDREDARKYVLDTAHALKRRGVIDITQSGRQVTALTLRKKAARRWLWAGMTALMVNTFRPGLLVAEIAQIADVEPRTVERWLAGEFAPSENALHLLFAHLYRLTPVSERERVATEYQSSARALAVFMAAVTEGSPVAPQYVPKQNELGAYPLAAGLFEALMSRYDKAQNLISNCGLSPGEARRASRFVETELMPLGDLVMGVLQRELRVHRKERQ